ncbi:MAG: DUF5686 and carboxypeptidase regulatory-like domain-containing protein [Microscillaceae bacterium]|nr:DUF5686 and carboxypeptidase regulatory-like domain-containing protein [Microscillaceae bacterium]MDW8460116.1 DUF5686 and carboxypeptidase regulatory-like domain-containing protein [Cytophagales bacterium]
MLTLRTIFSVFIAICLVIDSQGARLKGFVTDSNDNPLPFATIFVKGINLTTTTNEDGFFSIKLDKGTYFIVFTYIGYEKTELKVELQDETIELHVKLQPQAFQLQEVTITTIDQDPANAIIRKAQAKRKYYLNEEVKSYKCNAYIKGLQRITKKPARILGRPIRLDTGIVYFSESYSELAYMQPNRYKERMLSSKVSGKSQAFSFNQAADSWVNLYENIISDVGLGERGFVSPLANNAFAYYRFRFAGAFYQNNQLINKIKVIPKRKNAPAFAGYIYIIEDSWRLHSTDLYVPKGSIQFVDSARLQQVYLPHPANPEIWLPASQRVDFSFKAFGIEGKGYFIFIFSDYELEPAFPKKTFTNEVFSIEKDANKRDTTYWEQLRPIPLTTEERKEYRFKDSLEVVRESKPYKDSVDRKNNAYKFSNFIFGYTYRNSFKQQSISVPALGTIWQYNTVEGRVINANFTFKQNYENKKSYYISPTIRYGFANERLQAKIEANYLFNPQKRASISIEGGQFIEQISRQNSISPFLNTAYTIFLKENYLKIYEKAYFKTTWFQEILNGLFVNSYIEWAERRPLENNSSYTVFNIPNREFTSNHPTNSELNETKFNTHKAFTFAISVLFRPGQKYATYPNQKFIIENKYPNFRAGYRRGIPTLLNSEVDYDLLTIGMNDDWELGMIGSFSYDIEAGTFLNINRMYFIDYRHFLGNRTLLLQDDFRSFKLLDYYEFSTAKSYIKAHAEHHFNGFITNSIPLLKRWKWHLVLGANYLYTPTLKHYTEISAGFERMFKIIRAEFVTAFQQNKNIQTGIRLGIGF